MPRRNPSSASAPADSRSGGIWGVIETMINIRLTQRIANRLRTQLFDRLTRLPMLTLDEQRIGDSVYRVMYDSPQVPEICFNTTLQPTFVLLGAAFSLYFMQYTYGDVTPEVVWIAAAAIPFSLIVTFPLSSLARNINQASRASGAATTNRIEENIENISAVQSLGGMQRESKRFAEGSAESFRRHRHVTFFNYGLVSFGFLGAFVGGAVVVVIISNQVIGGELTAGDFTVLLGLFLSLGGAAVQIGTLWITLQSNIAAVRRVFFFIDFESDEFPNPETDAGRIDLAPLQRSIRLEDVELTYPDGRVALDNIDLEFNVGELVALVGPTGAGKTTLAYLLPAFLRPTRGRVLFDGTDIASVDVETLRNQVSYVFQEHLMLSRSIRDNLLLARPDASEADIEKACEDSGAISFIRELPLGLETVLGRSGNTLSVGQQQRLSIARGLLRNTRVLILDEPTAALDPQTENQLVRSLRNAAHDRLVLIIAHRLSTIRRADRIVFMEDGKISSMGSHDELMAEQDGPYPRFVALQQSGGREPL